MGICLKNNYNKDTDSSTLKRKLRKALKAATLDDFIDTTIEVLKGGSLPFSTFMDESKENESYNDSVTELISTIKEIASESKNELLNNLTPQNKATITRSLKDTLLSKPLSPAEQIIQDAIIPGNNLTTLEDLNKVRYKSFIDSIYEDTNSSFDEWRKYNFQESLFGCTVINTKQNSIVQNNYELNKNIINYLQEQYSIIYNYLQDYVLKDQINSELFPKNYFTSKTSDTAIKIPTKNNKNVFLAMYNHIKKLKSDNNLTTKLVNGYDEDFSQNEKVSEDRRFFQALNAYINLKFFDQTVKQTIGKFVTIDTTRVIPIDSEMDAMGNHVRTYKYSITTGNSNAIKTWGVENADAVKLVSDFNKFIIGRIPLYNYQIHKKEFGHLEIKNFLTAFLKLKEIGPTISSTSHNFKQWCEDITSETSFDRGSLFQIFSLLFDGKGFTKTGKWSTVANTSIINALLAKGMNINDLNVLYSVYTTVFKQNSTKKDTYSWYEIEQNFYKNTGMRSRYNLVDTVYGLICSNEALNYLETSYNVDTNKYETSIREKYSINKYKFELKNFANKQNYIRNNKKQYIKDYQYTESADQNTYKFVVGNMTYTITLGKDSSGNKVPNILAKKHSPSLFNITVSYESGGQTYVQNLQDFYTLDQMSIDTVEHRTQLINNTNSPFLKLLSFIDNALSLNFSKSPEALLEFYHAVKNQSTFLRDITLSAARSLVVSNMYVQLEEARTKEDKPYSRVRIKKFLEEQRKYKGLYDAEDQNEYFERAQIGEYLSVLHPNETWLSTLAKAHAIINQDTSSAVTNDFEGNHIPNTSPAYLSATHSIKEQIKESSESGEASNFLLFSEDRTPLELATVNLDIKSDLFKNKSQKDLTQSELFQDAFLHKFIYPILDNSGTVFIQSTTQSDKTKFIANKVKLKGIKLGSTSLYQQLKSPEFEKNVISSMKSTIGRAYQQVQNKVLKDYQTLFPQIQTLDQLNTFLKGGETVLWDNKTTVHVSSEGDLIKIVNNYNKTHNANLTLYRETHYRIFNGALAINELLDEFANNLYSTNNDRLNKRIILEKKRFIQSLTKNLTYFKVTPQLKTALSKLGVDYKLWTAEYESPTKKGGTITDSYLILAKQGDRDILYGDVDMDQDIELNPLLNMYFLSDNLIANNIRYATTGSELNHKIKELDNTDLNKVLRKRLEIDDSILESWFGQGPVTFYDLRQAVNNNNIPDAYKANIASIYDEYIYKMENLGQNAQFKRNVIMSATMTKFVPSLSGITTNMNIACINDVKASVFNFTDKPDAVDAHDGSAQVSPLWSILENKSLGSNEVGTVKKPIHHFYDNRYMSATLLKYATDSITNQWMRQSVGNDLNNNQHAINLYKIFKKMHHIRWSDANGNWRFGEVDLTTGCGYKESGNISFKDDILEGQELFYRKQATLQRIVDFGKENGVYYTIEEAYDDSHSSSGTQSKVYHYFDESGKHIQSNTLLNNSSYHTINSLFELHSAMGGIWSETWNGEEFVPSEASNIATVNFINNVCNLTSEGQKYEDTHKNMKAPAEFAYYDQPLKRAMIHMIANNSAVKNGAGNVNPNSSWIDDSDLSFMTISTKHYGIQQDSDHTADEAYMTEFSQVISSLDAGGYLHEYVSQIYQELGKTALNLSGVELEALKQFRDSGNKTYLYDLIGRSIIVNCKDNKNAASLTDAILKKIKKHFNLNTDHELDKFKIPFSDPNIYSQILSTIVSNINKKSIKRQYPGLGTVMVPSYNMSMIYEIDGNPMQFTDVLNAALMEGIKPSSSNLTNTEANQDIVKQYLRKKQESVSLISPSAFIPTDNVLVTLNKNTDFAIETHLSLNAIDNYYKFTDNPGVLIAEKLFNVKFKKVALEASRFSNIDQSKLPTEIYELALNKDTKYYLYKDSQLNKWILNVSNINLNTYEKERLLKSVALAIPEGEQLLTYSDSNIDEGIELAELGFELANTLNAYDVFGNITRNYKVWNQKNTLSFQKDVTIPRNLAPARIEFDYKDPATGQNVHTNIFNSYIIKNRILKLKALSENKSLSKAEQEQKANEIKVKYNSEQVFRDLKAGKFQLEDGTFVEISNLSNKAAEIIMSDLYASKFGISEGSSLYDVISKGPKYFKLPEVSINSTNYDLILTKNDGRHTFITFKPLAKNTDDFETESITWDNTCKVANQSVSNLASASPKVINKIYAVTKDNIRLFEIGREVVVSDIIWDPKQKVFTDLQGKKISNQSKYRRHGDKVLEYIEFISKHNAVEKAKNGAYVNFELYNINRGAIARTLEYENYTESQLLYTDSEGNQKKRSVKDKRNIQVNDFIASLLSKVYQTDSYSGIYMNSELTSKTAMTLSKVLPNFAQRISYDAMLSNYVKNLGDAISNYKASKDGLTMTCKEKTLNSLYKKYQMNIRDRVYTSFLRSLDFTVARIPAQTLQSFMKMRNVGFSGTKTGQCYVTAWQTWLQGSDLYQGSLN